MRTDDAEEEDQTRRKHFILCSRCQVVPFPNTSSDFFLNIFQNCANTNHLRLNTLNENRKFTHSTSIPRSSEPGKKNKKTRRLLPHSRTNFSLMFVFTSTVTNSLAETARKKRRSFEHAERIRKVSVDLDDLAELNKESKEENIGTDAQNISLVLKENGPTNTKTHNKRKKVKVEPEPDPRSK